MGWRSASILFADVKGYSGLDDEEMRIFSEKVLDMIADRIKDLSISHRNTWGDGIVLVSDQISEICEAALILQDFFKNLRWSRLGLRKLDIRISVHHGEMQESDDRLTGRPGFYGRTVVTAARVEPVTPPGRIWITETAAGLLRQHMEGSRQSETDYFALDPIGKITLPKRYGELTIAGLRRATDAPLSADELGSILEAEALRSGVRDKTARDQGLAEVIKETNVASFRIVIGIVPHDGKVLLVKRNRNAEQLNWMFPSGKKWPTDGERDVIEKEVQEEAGIACTVVEKIGERVHPLTNFHCVYYHLAPAGDLHIVNGDPVENAAVEWTPIDLAIRAVGPHLSPEVEKFLRTREKGA
ncbi:NUDIX domain-containing protein [Bradyrhizobium genosp. A]|uniref:NUDIX domain-containing protein n=1 Tax=Bradyrhizobium genosp. A TaxID=83626 RepID=UPI003CEF8488